MTCNKCKRKYETIWSVKSDLWSRIVPKHSDGSGSLCMECFSELARQKNIIIYWTGDIRYTRNRRDYTTREVAEITGYSEQVLAGYHHTCGIGYNFKKFGNLYWTEEDLEKLFIKKSKINAGRPRK